MHCTCNGSRARPDSVSSASRVPRSSRRPRRRLTEVAISFFSLTRFRASSSSVGCQSRLLSLSLEDGAMDGWTHDARTGEGTNERTGERAAGLPTTWIDERTNERNERALRRGKSGPEPGFTTEGETNAPTNGVSDTGCRCRGRLTAHAI